MTAASGGQPTNGARLSLEQALAAANHLLSTGRVGEADQLARQIIAARPDDPRALCVAGMAAFLADRADEGAALLERAVALRPDMADAFFNLGKLQMAQARIEAAKQAFTRFLELRPDHVLALNWLGNLLSGDGAHDAAIAAYRRALRIAPDAPETTVNLALALSAAGRDAEARGQARRAVELLPDHDGAHAVLGVVLMQAGDPEQAATSFERAATLNPGDTRHPINLAIALHRVGRHQPALEACERALARSPRDTKALHYKTALLALLGRHDERARLVPIDRLVWERAIVPPASSGGLAGFNRALVEAILCHPTLAPAAVTRTTRGGRQTANLLAGATGVLAEFAAIVRRAVEDYAAHLAALTDHPMAGPAPGNFELNCWANVLDDGGHQLSHFHPTSWVSGVYYPQVPDSIAAGQGDHAGWIAFGRPLEGFDVPDGSPERWFHPREGIMLLFPGWLGHRTEPFQADRHRVSMAFDAVPLNQPAAR